MSKMQVHHDNMELLRTCGITEEMLLELDDSPVAQLVDMVEQNYSSKLIMDYYQATVDKKEVNTMDRSERAARKAGKVARTSTDTAKAASKWIATDGKAHARAAGRFANRLLKRGVRKSIAISKAARDAYNEVE